MSYVDKSYISRLDFINKVNTLNDEAQEIMKGVYTENDLLYPITYAEMTHWLIVLDILKPVLSYYEVTTKAEDLGLSVYMIKDNGSLSSDLGNYKMSPDMEGYLRSIINGYRYSPVIFVYSFLNFIEVFNLQESLGLDELYKRVESVDFI